MTQEFIALAWNNICNSAFSALPIVKPLKSYENETSIRRTQHHSKSRRTTPRTGLHCSGSSRGYRRPQEPLRRRVVGLCRYLRQVQRRLVLRSMDRPQQLQRLRWVYQLLQGYPGRRGSPGVDGSGLRGIPSPVVQRRIYVGGWLRQYPRNIEPMRAELSLLKLCRV